MNIINIGFSYSMPPLKRAIEYSSACLLIMGIALSILSFIRIASTCFSFGLLHLSLTCSSLNITKFFIRFLGLDVNKKNSYGFIPLYYAAGFENLDAAKLLIEQGADVKNRAKNGQTPLGQAIIKRNRNFIKLLIEYGADIDEEDESGNTSLIRALMDQDLNLVKFLIECGAAVEKQVSHGRTPLQIAINQRNKDLISLLIQHGADINKKCGNGKTLLIEAISEGDLALVEFLIEFGVDLDQEDEDGNIPLTQALDQADTEMIKCLINHGADINKLNGDGSTILIKLIIRFIIFSCVINFNIPISILISEFERIDHLLRYLVTHGADVNKKSSSGQTPLRIAIEVTIVLVSIGALPNPGFTLDFERVDELIQCLIRQGADIDKEAANGETPLSRIAKIGNNKLTQLFLKVNASGL